MGTEENAEAVASRQATQMPGAERSETWKMVWMKESIREESMAGEERTAERIGERARRHEETFEQTSC